MAPPPRVAPTIMPSDAQIAANRRNAQRSTGPRTPEGQAAVRFNALSHGLSARAVLLPGEDPTELHLICERLLASCEDENRRFLLEEMAVTQFELARLRRLQVDIQVRFEDHPTADDNINKLERVSRIISRLQRHYFKCQAELRRLPPPAATPQKSPIQTQFEPAPLPDTNNPGPQPVPTPQPASSAPAAPPQKSPIQTQFSPSNPPSTLHLPLLDKEPLKFDNGDVLKPIAG
jgi:hypothetical protein